MAEFNYLGKTFKPLQTLKGKAADFSAISKKIDDIGLTPEGWNYKKFYDVAEQNNAGDFDLFEMDGKVVIPADNYLFAYRK